MLQKVKDQTTITITLEHDKCVFWNSQSIYLQKPKMEKTLKNTIHIKKILIYYTMNENIREQLSLLSFFLYLFITNVSSVLIKIYLCKSLKLKTWSNKISIYKKQKILNIKWKYQRAIELF